MKIIVCHAYYGCDTGCCGHILKVDGEQISNSFTFSHPYIGTIGDAREFAEDMVREHFGEEHIKDLDWENCVVLDD